MREILFRGKQLDSGKWLEGYITYRYRYDKQSKKEILGPVIDTPHKFAFGEAAGMVIGSIQVTQGTEGQFTGLTDRNGTKIFEGDIVEAVLTDGIHYGFSWGRQVVVFDRGAFGLKDRREEITPMCNYAANVAFEVLGNIYDNPELLEATE